MPLWKNTDANTSVPLWALNQLNVSANANNGNLLFGNTTANAFVTGKTIGLFGVDTSEEQASANGAPTHAGWVMRTVGQGGRAGRITYETLVAMGSMSSDASDDSIFADYKVVIVVQPSNSNLPKNNAVNLIVVANTTPYGGTLSYYWQQDGGNAVASWANVPNTGTFASANGNTTATLSIANNFLVAGNTFRVLVGVANGYTVPSANVTVSYT